MIIPIHEAWDRQPPAGTPIDWSNPVVRALAPTDLWVPDVFGGRNLVRRAHADIKASQASVGPSAHGMSINGTGITTTSSVSGFETLAGACDYTGAAALTMFALLSFSGNQSGDGYEAPIIRTDQDGTPANAHMALDVFQGPASYVIRPLLATSGTSGWTASNDVNVGSPDLNALYLVVARYAPVIEAGIRVFFARAGAPVASAKNGASSASGAVTTNNGTASNMQTHVVGMAYVGAASLKGCLYYAGISASAISDDAVRSWAGNPWQIFQP